MIIMSYVFIYTVYIYEYIYIYMYMIHVYIHIRYKMYVCVHVGRSRYVPLQVSWAAGALRGRESHLGVLDEDTVASRSTLATAAWQKEEYSIA